MREREGKKQRQQQQKIVSLRNVFLIFCLLFVAMYFVCYCNIIFFKTENHFSYFRSDEKLFFEQFKRIVNSQCVIQHNLI